MCIFYRNDLGSSRAPTPTAEYNVMLWIPTAQKLICSFTSYCNEF